MNALKFQRILFLLLAFAIVLSGVYVMLIYELVYYLSFEYLNSNEKYRRLESYKTYNWLFIAYMAFEVAVRTHVFKLNARMDYHVNTAEHLFFTFLISMSISIYLHFFNLLEENRLLKLLTVFVILNIIGVLNEFFQNFYQHEPLFVLEGNDLKDLVVNVIGSSLFVIVSLIFRPKKMLNLTHS